MAFNNLIEILAGPNYIQHHSPYQRSVIEGNIGAIFDQVLQIKGLTNRCVQVAVTYKSNGPDGKPRVHCNVVWVAPNTVRGSVVSEPTQWFASEHTAGKEVENIYSYHGYISLERRYRKQTLAEIVR
jgi:hypothetical protein